MFNISTFLNKLSKKINSVEEEKTTILEIIEKETGANINPDDIEVRNDTIFLKTNPAIKNKIFIFKEKILADINSKISAKITQII